MAKSASNAVPYRDEPEAGDESRAETRSMASAMSLHEYRDDESGAASLPSYDELEPTVQNLRTNETWYARELVPELRQKPCLRFQSRTREWVTLCPALSQDPVLLHNTLTEQAKYPPRPVVHVLGSHAEVTRDKDGKKTERRVTDFDLSVDVSEVFKHRVPQVIDRKAQSDGTEPRYWHSYGVADEFSPVHLGTIFKKTRLGLNAIRPATNADGETGPETEFRDDAEYWAQCFTVASRSWRPTSFRFRRVVLDWDTKMVRENLDALIRATNYRGDVQINFPVEDDGFTILSNHKINRIRSNTYVWWVCIILQLWIITWPILFFLVKRYDVVRAYWPYSKADHSRCQYGHCLGLKEYASVSEQQWLNSWGRTIAEKALAKYQGWIDWDAVRASISARERLGQLANASEHGTDVDFTAQREDRIQVDLGNGWANAAVGAVGTFAAQRSGSSSGQPQGWGENQTASGSSTTLKIGKMSARF